MSWYLFNLVPRVSFCDLNIFTEKLQCLFLTADES